MTNVKITVLGAGGEPVSGGWLRVSIPDAEDSSPFGPQRRAESLEHGSASFLVGSNPVDVLIEVPGLRTERLTGVREDRTVTLREAPWIYVALDPSVELPEPPAFLHPSLERLADAKKSKTSDIFILFDGARQIGVGGSGWFGHTQAFDESRLVKLPVGEPGKFRLKFMHSIGATRHDLRGPPGRGGHAGARDRRERQRSHDPCAARKGRLRALAERHPR